MRLRFLTRNAATALLWLLLATGVAHAHGGMAGPDELGPPVGMSVAIGLACYYIITLWPSGQRGNGRKMADKTTRRSAK